MNLVVTEAFGDYAKGDRIVSGVAAVLASHPGFVVQVSGDEDAGPAPEPVAEAAPAPEAAVTPEPAPEPSAPTQPEHPADAPSAA